MVDCPYCGKKLDPLGVVVRATMFLDSTTGYSPVNEIEETLEYYCPECGADLDFDSADELAKSMEENLSTESIG